MPLFPPSRPSFRFLAASCPIASSVRSTIANSSQSLPSFLPSLFLPLLFTTTSPSFLNFEFFLVLGNVGFRSLLHRKKIKNDFVS